MQKNEMIKVRSNLQMPFTVIGGSYDGKRHLQMRGFYKLPVESALYSLKAIWQH